MKIFDFLNCSKIPSIPSIPSVEEFYYDLGGHINIRYKDFIQSIEINNHSITHYRISKNGKGKILIEIRLHPADEISDGWIELWMLSRLYDYKKLLDFNCVEDAKIFLTNFRGFVVKQIEKENREFEEKEKKEKLESHREVLHEE